MTKKRLQMKAPRSTSAKTARAKSKPEHAEKWTETEESKQAAPARKKWVEDNTTAISIRMPNSMLEILRAVAATEGIGYQTLIKKWLHRDIERLVDERRAQRAR